jgi:N-methylhydantoinase A
MGFSIDIDTGGTFTDGFIRGNGRFELVKVPTTPHDLTFCFLDCINEAAKKLGYESADRLLPETDTVRLSTTIGTNALINRSGPKLGLLATRGYGENAYAPMDQVNPAVGFLVPMDMIVGINEEMSKSGETVTPPAPSEVLAGIKYLLERGARRIVVSLANSPMNPVHEKQCRDIVLANYPAHYLGTVPLLLSTEISIESNDQYRTNAALIDAYIHQDMAHYLYKADEDIRKNRFKRPLLIVHATGGVCRVAKTKAIDTCDSGPAAGLFGAAFIARMYNLKNVMTVDIGGTSTDIGLVIDGEPTYTREKDLGGLAVRETAIETVSIGAGGSSIIKVDKTGKLTIGPDSAGGIPGPACFGLGGTNPCTTDAWVTLGYIDPGYFLGGRRKLDPQKARNAVKRRAADSLKMTETQAAEAALQLLTTNCAGLLRDYAHQKNVALDDITMFAFGGSGGLLCPGIARASGIKKVRFFRFGAQFCAFGSSCTDILHEYNTARNIPLSDNNRGIIEEFNKAVRQMTDDAYFDMEGEGFGKDRVKLSLEIVLSEADASMSSTVRFPVLRLNNKEDISKIINLYRGQQKDPEDNIPIHIRELRLKASCHLVDPVFPAYPAAGTDPQKAFKGMRPAYFDGQLREAPVYDENLLQSGNIVRGFAFVESPHTTVLVPPGARYTVDQYLNGLMEEE